MKKVVKEIFLLSMSFSANIFVVPTVNSQEISNKGIDTAVENIPISNSDISLQESTILFLDDTGNEVFPVNETSLCLGANPTDNYQVINEALNYASSNNISAIKLPEGSFVVSNYIQLPSGVGLEGTLKNGIKQTTLTNIDENQPIVSMDSRTMINDIKLDGHWNGEKINYKQRGILVTPFEDKNLVGGYPANQAPLKRVTDVTIKDVDVSNIGGSAIYLDYAEKVSIFGTSSNKYNKQLSIDRVGYGGVIAYSTNNSHVENISVKNIGLELAKKTQSYGIAFSWHKGQNKDDQNRYQKSCDNTVTNNVITNNPGWEGIDTHSGNNFIVKGNIITSVRYPIVVGGMDYENATITAYPPKDITISDNQINLLEDKAGTNARSDIFCGRGIVATGAKKQTLESTELGFLKGLTIKNNTIEQIRSESNTRGGISLHITYQANVSSNMITNSLFNGIVLMSSNKKVTIDQNKINQTAGSGADNSVAIGIRGSHNNGNETNTYTKLNPLTADGTLIQDNSFQGFSEPFYMKDNAFNSLNGLFTE